MSDPEDLPPLPSPFVEAGYHIHHDLPDLYSLSDMHAYAQAAIAHERSARLKEDSPDLMAILHRYTRGDILDNGPEGSMRYLSDVLEELIAGRVAEEREDCAKACEGMPSTLPNGIRRTGIAVAWSCAAAIRGRGKE